MKDESRLYTKTNTLLYSKYDADSEYITVFQKDREQKNSLLSIPFVSTDSFHFLPSLYSCHAGTALGGTRRRDTQSRFMQIVNHVTKVCNFDVCSLKREKREEKIIVCNYF